MYSVHYSYISNVVELKYYYYYKNTTQIKYSSSKTLFKHSTRENFTTDYLWSYDSMLKYRDFFPFTSISQSCYAQNE